MVLEFRPELFLAHLKKMNFLISGSLHGRATDCVRFEFSNSFIKLSTNNLKIASQFIIPRQNDSLIYTDVSFLVSGKLFYELLSKLPSGDLVSLRIQDNNILISSSSGDYNLTSPSMDGFDFPEIPVGGSIYRMTESDLSYIIAHVEDFTSNDDTFTSLQGVLFSQRENTLHVVATDRTKLGMVEFPAECEIPRSSIVPIGFLTSIKHLLGSSDSNVTLGFAEDRVYLKNENFVAFSSLIDQVFPNYLPVINTAESLGISLPVKALRDSLLRMSCLADNHKPLFELLFDNNTLTLTSQNPNSSGKEVLTLSKNKQTVNHPPFSLVLSGMSLINILDFYSSDCVAFLNTNKKPVVFKSSEHPSLTYVQTPFFK